MQRSCCAQRSGIWPSRPAETGATTSSILNLQSPRAKRLDLAKTVVAHLRKFDEPARFPAKALTGDVNLISSGM